MGKAVTLEHELCRGTVFPAVPLVFPTIANVHEHSENIGGLSHFPNKKLMTGLWSTEIVTMSSSVRIFLI